MIVSGPMSVWREELETQACGPQNRVRGLIARYWLCKKCWAYTSISLVVELNVWLVT